MNESVVADRYARALLEIGSAGGQLTVFLQQLRDVAQVFAKNPQLQVALRDPGVEESRRLAIVDDLARRLGLLPVLLNALKVLVVRRRIGVLSQIAVRMAQLADERAGIARATVVSAVRLPESQAVQLTAELERLTGKKIIIEHREDPSLLAGLIARVGDHVIDTSLKGQLAELQRLLVTSPATG